MKKAEVRIGGLYVVNVSGTRVPVRITNENPYGGWDGINTKTGREVHIRSAQRLQREILRPSPLTVAAE